MDNNKVYAYKRTDQADYKSIACNCEYREDPDAFTGLCYLTPPDRGHMIEGRIAVESSDGFVFMSEGYAPGEWMFTEITLENLRGRFGHLVMADGRLDGIKSTGELQEYFRSLY